MELRELRAFVAAGRELHFARAAALLFMSPSAMSDLIRRLEQELGTPLFERTTRRIRLTDAGTELLARAETILELTAQATEAVAAIGRGQSGALRMGVTPPAAPVLAPHLAARFTALAPDRSVEIERMWLPAVGAALQAGTIDVALTCGDLGSAGGSIVTVELGAEPLLVGLRPGHELAGESAVDLAVLRGRVLGLHPACLFPAWHAVQRRILDDAGIDPPVVELEDSDLSARRWSDQGDVEWIMLMDSLLAGHDHTAVVPVEGRSVPFTLSWSVDPVRRSVVQRFVACSREAALPPGWLPAEG